IDGYRGLYNSAWIGSVGVLYASMVLSLFGFYISKNSINHDKETGVAEIIASTQMKKWQYTLGKVFSNFCVLLSMLVVIFLGLIMMQFVRGEEMHIQVWDIFAPILFIGVPVMLITAALAMLFETIPGLDKGVGNIVYILLCIGVFLMSAFITNFIDPYGVKLIINSFFSQSPITPQDGTHAISVGEILSEPLPSFLYTGIKWTFSIILNRTIWIIVGLQIAIVSSVFFNRFNPERKIKQMRARKRKEQKEKIRRRKPKELIEFQTKVIEEEFYSSENLLKSFKSQKYHFRFFFSVWMGCKLYFKQIPFWLKILMLGVIVGCILSPLWVTRQYLLPAAWILPIFLWSKLGTYERKENVDDIIFSTPYPIKLNVLSTWIIGLIISACTGLGGAIKFIIVQEWASLLFWGAGCVFIPSLALFLSVITGSGKTFEFLYALIWYIGPMNQISYLDYMGVIGLSIDTYIWLIYFSISIILVVLVYVGRIIQFRKE
ncbi:MAG: hypothetical protein H7641_01620, partial [Candidatus Heimdallarchaeota archaeon]|nr:hypothetical protein [Candidatus Heimdallarchaeota archaeon]MCK4876261.1 hypothetical protein [Candidatus Heimdallarchaeota archaeon]